MRNDEPEARNAVRWGRLAVLAGPLLALALALPHVGSGLISDDGAILAWVHRQPPLADALGPQYGLSSIRFWRPLTTLSFDVQEVWTGVAPAPLRLFNALAHALAALAAAGLVGALGARPWAMALAGLWVASFPHQGGTTGWPAGRVDALCLPLVLGALWAAFRARSGAAVLLAVLAIATKEMGWVVAPAALLLGLARGDGVRVAVVRAAPLAAAVALTIGLRPLLLGTWIGGYPGPGPDVAEVLRGAPVALARGVGWASGPVLLAAGVAIAVRRGVGSGALLAGLAAALVATFLLAHLVTGGEIPPEHLRTLLVPDALVGVGAAWALSRATGARAAPSAAKWLLVALVGAGLVARAEFARRDLATWAAAGDRAEQLLADVRKDAAEHTPDGGPLLFAAPPRLDADGRAYVLHFGAAERLRAPFAGTARALWPWRPMFAGVPEREWYGAAIGAVLDPAATAVRVSKVPLVVAGQFAGQVSGQRLSLAAADVSGAAARGPRLGLGEGTPALQDALQLAQVAAGAEVLLATDQGYAVAPLDPALLEQLVAAEGAALADLLRPLGAALLHAVEFGADGALVELRLVDAAGETLVRLGPLELHLEPDLVRFLRGG
ncbi:MAG: hypothetical protein GC161_01190 [Planctomycetaceae bacterium]|nr:hypothetical protein [Planctomycetaceae bacterium]